MLNASGQAVREVETSFGMMLRKLAWLPAVTSEGSDQHGRRLEVGSKLFVKSPEAVRLLAGHVSYLLPDPMPTSTLATFLGIQRSISIDFTAEMLKSWCSRGENTSAAPVAFRTSLQHMRSVYHFLDQHMTKHQLEELLHNHPVIFYPRISHGVATATAVDGVFLYRSEVMWVDETGLFDKYRESLLNADPDSAKLYRYPLCTVYPDMKEFFTRTVHVMRSPGTVELCRLLTHITATCTVSKALPDVLSIFSLIGHALLAGDEVSGVLRDQLEQLKTEKVIPGKSGSWLGLDCHPMIADDRNLEKMFPDNATVFFVDCGEKLGVGNTRKRSAQKGRCNLYLGELHLMSLLTVFIEF